MNEPQQIKPIYIYIYMVRFNVPMFSVWTMMDYLLWIIHSCDTKTIFYVDDNYESSTHDSAMCASFFNSSHNSCISVDSLLTIYVCGHLCKNELVIRICISKLTYIYIYRGILIFTDRRSICFSYTHSPNMWRQRVACFFWNLTRGYPRKYDDIFNMYSIPIRCHYFIDSHLYLSTDYIR